LSEGVADGVDDGKAVGFLEGSEEGWLLIVGWCDVVGVVDGTSLGE
jgi:hypothetical protein